jgi:hypothetical protein
VGKAHGSSVIAREELLTKGGKMTREEMREKAVQMMMKRFH